MTGDVSITVSKKHTTQRLKCISRLPNGFVRCRGLLAEGNIPVNGGRLRAKVLVFDKPENLRACWRKYLGGDLGAQCLGAVNSLMRHVERFPGKRERVSRTRWIEADRRYFCVIGLVLGHLTMRIVSHESVHAAFAFVNRKSRAWWDKKAKDNDEEAVAYPVGEIAANTVAFLERAKLLDPGRVTQPSRAEVRRRMNDRPRWSHSVATHGAHIG